MAIKSGSRSLFARLHFVVRFLGVTGLFALGIGLAMAATAYAWAPTLTGIGTQTRELFTQLTEGGLADRFLRTSLIVVTAGAGLLVLWILVEVVILLRVLFGRRGVVGLNALFQVALAVVLLAGVNYFVRQDPRRYDWTRDARFTLPEHIKNQLVKLQGTTTIVVYQRYKTFSRLSDKPDNYDTEAAAKVTEKVMDLVELFSKMGPRFNVVYLQADDSDFSRRLDEITREVPELKQAIDLVRENSIFFLARDRAGKGYVQQMSFHEFIELDKTASRTANDGQGNLVLLPQGVELFARKVLNLQARAPRVGILVNWELLTTEGPKEYGLRGLRDALMGHGFEVVDIVLAKPSPTGLEPVAYTLAESRFSSIDERLETLDEILGNIKESRNEYESLHDNAKAGRDEALAEGLVRLQLSRLEEQLGGSVLVDPLSIRQRVARVLAAIPQLTRSERAEVEKDVITFLGDELASLQRAHEMFSAQREKRIEERARYDTEELAELRRETDVKKKFGELLKECDLVIVPRMTIESLRPRMVIPNAAHQFHDEQVEAIREYLKSGKGLLACLGPTSRLPSQLGAPPPPDRPNPLEDMLADLGFNLTRETILYDIEAEALSGLQVEDDLGVPSLPEKMPPVDFRRDPIPPGGGIVHDLPHPIRSSMRIAARSIDKGLELEIRYPRPVGYAPLRSEGKGGAASEGFQRGAGKEMDWMDKETLGLLKSVGTRLLPPTGSIGDVTRAVPLTGEKGMPSISVAKGQAPDHAKLDAIIKERSAEQIQRTLQVGSLLVGAGTPLSSLLASAMVGEIGTERHGEDKPANDRLETQVAFMLTTEESWREDNPFPSRGKLMWGEPGKRGPFPVGVAAEVPIPLGWFGNEHPVPESPSARTAVIGHGKWFVGDDLSPAKERLLLDTCNWLLRRDEVMVKDEGVRWSYPRVELSRRSRFLWGLGLAVGLPLLFVYLGVTIQWIRRLR